MPKGMVTVPFNPQLINTGSKLVLIDCGNGVANLEPSKGAVGRTLQNLAAAGTAFSFGNRIFSNAGFPQGDFHALALIVR